LIGTVIIFITVPFCFSQPVIPAKAPACGTGRGIQQDNAQGIQLTPSFISPLVRSTTLRAGRLIEGRLNGGQDTLKKDTSTITKSTEKKFRMKKSPWLAVGFSAVLPGLGQLYNQSYWKVPIILGLSAYLGYQLYDNHKKYADYRDQYAATQTPENPAGNESLKDLRELYRGQRDDFIWYFTIVYVINLVDAYVDAHLFDFDIREEKIQRFGKIDKEYKLNVKIKF
jgi:hypothetical protein